METASRHRARGARPCWVLALALAGLAGGGACKRRAESVRPRSTDGGRAQAAAVLEGQVIDRRERPVPEARVLAFRQDGIEGAGDQRTTEVPEVAETATDMGGRFRLERLAPGLHRVLVEAAGFPTAEASGVAAPGAGLVFRLDGEGHTILGRVVGGDGPRAGARVMLAPDDGGLIRETTTRAGGGFAFGGLGPGRYAVRAAHELSASPMLRDVAAADVGSAPSITLVLRPAAGIPGRVLDDAGGGLAGVAVRIESAAAPLGEDPLPTVVRSEVGGHFAAAPLLPGAYRLTASRAGYILRRAPIVELPSSQSGSTPPGPIVLELLRGARVTGRVLGAGGGPVRDAHVRCVAGTFEDLTVQVGPLPLAAEAAAMPSGSGRALGTSRVAVSDREGRFVVDNLVPGRYRIEISHPGSEPYRSGEMAIAPGERRDVGGISLRAAVAVEGRVLGEEGLAIEGARVVVGAAQEGGGLPAAAGLSAVTDAEGRFTLALPAGGYRLSATAPGRGTAHRAIEVGPASAAAARPRLEIRLVKAEARLEGLVRDTGGRPLARARLSLWPFAADRGNGTGTGEGPVGTGTTDVGGHFSLSQIPAGDLRLEVQHPDYPSTVQDVTAGKYAMVTVPFPGAISGEVRSKATGAPLVRARIEAVGPSGAKATADARRAGTFRLGRLAPGTWRLVVSAPGFKSSERDVEVPPSLSLGEPSVRELRVDLEGG